MPAVSPFNETFINPMMEFTVIGGGSAGNHTVTGIRPEDTLKAVIGFTFNEGTPNTGTARALTSEFSITADDTINNTGGTDTTGGILFVFYLDMPEDQRP